MWRAPAGGVGYQGVMRTRPSPEFPGTNAFALLHLSGLVAQNPPVLPVALTEALQGENSSLLERLQNLDPSLMAQLKPEFQRLHEVGIRFGPLWPPEMDAFLASLSRSQPESR